MHSPGPGMEQSIRAASAVTSPTVEFSSWPTTAPAREVSGSHFRKTKLLTCWLRRCGVGVLRILALGKTKKQVRADKEYGIEEQ